MNGQKPLEFHGKAGGYFILTILSIILIYIPFFGWALLLNYSSGWFAKNALVNGRKVIYKAGYGESLGFVFVNGLLTIITIGIYSFWFYPKMYRYMVEHTNYVDETVPAPTAVTAIAEPQATTVVTASPPESVDPTPPVPPTPIVQ